MMGTKATARGYAPPVGLVASTSQANSTTPDDAAYEQARHRLGDKAKPPGPMTAGFAVGSDTMHVFDYATSLFLIYLAAGTMAFFIYVLFRGIKSK